MPAITYSSFEGGLDHRLPIGVQDANKLWSLKNAYTTLGKRLKKRPCLRLLSSALSGSFGLEAISGRLKVFCDTGSGFAPPSYCDKIILDIPSWSAGVLSKIHYADQFTGYPFVVAEYSDATVGHHYVDTNPAVATISIATPGVVTMANAFIAGQEVVFSTTGALPTGLVSGTTYYVLAPSAANFTVAATVGGAAIATSGVQSGVHTVTARTPITDVNNPRSKSVTKAASRVFAINGETVRYCKAGSPRDWTTASDAGFLPTGLQQDTKSSATAVGTFQDALVVFFPEGAQIWNVATDPSANAISKRIYGVGCKAPMSLASFSSDLMFLSPFGFRSMTVQVTTARIDDTDVGVPIDSLVQSDIATSEVVSGQIETFGVWIHQLGQYWSVFDMGLYSKVWAYTYSKSSKLASWSEYIFPVRIRAIATLDGKVYLRTDANLYEVSPDIFTDNGTLVDVEIQMAFQDSKSPGVLKQFYGADLVVSGTPSISFKYDPRDLAKESIAQDITGDTRPGDIVPIEICSAALAPVFRHSKDEAFEMDALTLYFNPLGVV